MTDESAPGSAPLTDEERLRTSPMSLDRGSAVWLADEEAAFLRHARWGELPSRVQPSQFVEAVDVENRTNVPQQAFDPREWGEAGRR